MKDRPKFIFSLGFVFSYLCMVLWIVSGFYLHPPFDTIVALFGLFSFMLGYVLLLAGITALSPFRMGGKGWHLKAISIVVALLIPLRLFMEKYIREYPIIKHMNGILLILALTITLFIILIRIQKGVRLTRSGKPKKMKGASSPKAGKKSRKKVKRPRKR